jgi:hypothetical protein
MDDRDLVLRFESLGDNCELGIVQRRADVEPLGLLRFAGAPLSHVLRGLNARFAGIADPDQVRVEAERGEYMVNLAKYEFRYHADAKVGEADPDALRRQQVRTVGFLADKLLRDLEAAEKIMVFRQNEPLLATDLVDLRAALSRIGPSTLLWVTEARPGHPPGTVDVIDARFMVGYVRRLAPRDEVPDADVESWMSVLRRAWAAWPLREGTAPAAPAAPAEPGRVDAVFGAGGNAAGLIGFGWSAPEDGFTWSIDDRSQILLDPPPEASDYWLEMDLSPFVAPPALPRQSLRIIVNGSAVHQIEAVQRGTTGCVVPGILIRGRKKIDIVLEHPHAARPCDVAGEKDDRRLAVAFRRLSLVCAPLA